MSEQLTAGATHAVGTNNRPRRGTVTGFRIMTGLLVLSIVVQAVSAGELLSGGTGFRGVHAIGGMVVLAFAVTTVILAVVGWRQGAVPGWPSITSAVIVLACIGQIMLGSTDTITAHVPLGVALAAGSTALTVYAWRPRRRLDR